MKVPKKCEKLFGKTFCWHKRSKIYTLSSLFGIWHLCIGIVFIQGWISVIAKISCWMFEAQNKYTSIVYINSGSVPSTLIKLINLIYAHNAPYISNLFVCAIYIDNPVDNLELGHRGYLWAKFNKLYDRLEWILAVLRGLG